MAEETCWIVEYRWNPNKLIAKYGDTRGCPMTIQWKPTHGRKRDAENVLRHSVKFADCVDIVRVVRSDKWDEEAKKKYYCRHRTDICECALTGIDCDIGRRPWGCPLEQGAVCDCVGDDVSEVIYAPTKEGT